MGGAAFTFPAFEHPEPRKVRAAPYDPEFPVDRAVGWAGVPRLPPRGSWEAVVPDDRDHGLPRALKGDGGNGDGVGRP